MFNAVSRGVVVTGLLFVSAFTLPLAAQSQAPYWDNSAPQNQPFYSPNNAQAAPSQYNSAPQQQNYNSYDNGQGSTLRGYIATAPAGTVLNVTNTASVSSLSARAGDPISVTLSYDLSMGGRMVLPGGTQIQGQVISSIPAGRTARNGELQIRFNNALLPDGRQIPLSARLITQDGTGILRGGTKNSRVGTTAKNTLGGAAIGAAAGTALGAITSGGRRWNEGLLWGSVLGAGAGLAKTGIDRGVEAELQPGTPMQIMLDQPVNVTSGGTSTPSSW